MKPDTEFNLKDRASVNGAFRFELQQPVKWQGQDAVVIGRSYGSFWYSIRLADENRHGIPEDELQPVEECVA